MGEEAGWDFFVSYAADDVEWAEWIAWHLEAAGYRVLCEAWDAVAGSSRDRLIDDAVGRSVRTLAVLSAAYLRAPSVQSEWRAAWRRDPDGLTRRLIPVRIDACEPEGLLGGVVPIDLFGLDEAGALARLQTRIDGARAGRQKPAGEPPFPARGGNGRPDGSQPTPRPPAPQPARPGHETPALLPRDIRDFTGRRREIAELDAMLGPGTSTMVISAVDGTAGVGKTTLAVHWGHRVKDRFPDGQIYLDLRGYAPTLPMQPRRALGLLLGALGVTDADIPMTLEARSLLYRRLTGSRRTLLVLDNALDVEHVRPLLPAGTCLALITSRSRLSGLAVRDGARLISLDVLSPDESTALLRQVLGEVRVERELAAAERLAQLCGHLPLALRIAAVRLLTRPGFDIADAVFELADENARIDVLSRDSDEHAAVRSVFSWSYLRLRPVEQRVFRLLGLHRGPSLSDDAVAALVGVPTAQAGAMLHTLVALHLIEEERPRRYRIHDLLRLYAGELCTRDEPAQQRRAAVERILYWYVATCTAAATLVEGRTSDKSAPLAPHAVVRPLVFGSASQALAWFDDEYATMLDIANHAYSNELDDLCGRLALAAWPFFQRRSRWADWIELQQVSLAGARRSGDEQTEAWLLGGLGDVLDDQERYEEALECHQRAIDIHRRLGNPKGEAVARNNLAVSLDNLERYPEAIEHYTAVLAMFRDLGDLANVGMVLNNLGAAHFMIDQFDAAERHYREALEIRQALEDAFGEGMTLHNLADVAEALDRLDEARDWYERSIPRHRAAGHLRGEARALHFLGRVNQRQGDLETARAHWRAALDIFERVGDPEADDLLALLADTRTSTPGA
ncbi:Tetratricopeptide TPR_2 repeat protein [Parafrankia sp. EAN1pec]|uniref:tetratricopeptide repeat protein n=1 Tax=Parafrankia sp. (strain EAN1pec) TaxID=298653 RepID=UPI0000541089|nr:Tetratricopeptide TPR_2 repeat protein [Frankia sp. EAN1pec]